MAELTQPEQAEVVRKALALETAIAVESAEAQLVRRSTFDRFPAYSKLFVESEPEKPQRRIAEPAEPVQPEIPAPPESSYSYLGHLVANPGELVALVLAIVFGIIVIRCDLPTLIYIPLFILSTAAFWVSVLISFKSYGEEKGLRDAELAQAPEYRLAVSQAEAEAEKQNALREEEAARRQAELDKLYESEMERYNSELVPAYHDLAASNRREYEEMRSEYEHEKADWEEKRSSALSALEADIAANEAELASLYASSGIVSIHYREIPLLKWLHDDMSTSDHDIRYATELLDRNRQRIATEEAGKRTSDAVDQLADQVRAESADMKLLQGIQIGSLRNLEAISSEILRTSGDVFESSKRILLHARVNTADIAAREWRRKTRKAIGRP